VLAGVAVVLVLQGAFLTQHLQDWQGRAGEPRAIDQGA
jgi:hypothetical protein